jgi:hypothetical protein
MHTSFGKLGCGSSPRVRTCGWKLEMGRWGWENAYDNTMAGAQKKKPNLSLGFLFSKLTKAQKIIFSWEYINQ